MTSKGSIATNAQRSDRSTGRKRLTGEEKSRFYQHANEREKEVGDVELATWRHEVDQQRVLCCPSGCGDGSL